ncbi:ATP-dependent zinc metalloprotease FtsH [Truepera radiovictrix]|uniref:ATP-dependent zinc metalloprotease FtsH n=1 Tax=Truepera radiovictrix (strain DSM 17093 / CIP 108686 / LMG 22925 / RQ-24) TaxID=649638 RepID=D7CWV0_TRURR|nr:ATP-dependent zinc metalloprotease FtsH [Truepera radiovictrix]ADI14458.1 ATP-dependent metalloprotease FtsH [Truepera radiovictrix DSM 17093]WMT56985.1 ATP-dependent zinc metalloprotease FtsH [Truepera radiovictrix]
MGKFPVRSVLIGAVVLGVVVFVASQNGSRGGGNVRDYSYFARQLESGAIDKVVVGDGVLEVSVRGGESYTTRISAPLSTEELSQLDAQVNTVEVAPRSQNWGGILITLLPIILIIAFMWYLMRGMRTGGDGAMQFGKSRARMITEENSQTLFKDVAGVEEAKNDLYEVVEFLKNPAKFHALGARIPHGVLMVGPPGSGKTHLAKAVAGEAKVPFFSISGSDFVEMFVGVGAARVRDLFESAKKNAPCIVFIDEIDAVGRRRGMNINGGNDEREQTLNALLVEMDGFESKHDIIIIAATNRPDVLDPALLRPGRFDRQVVVDAPDVKGREAILQIHARGKPLSQKVDLRTVAKRTPGFVGADLENLLNEAALVAARAGRKEILPADIDEAADRVVMGPERRSRVISPKEKKITAYHEGGHALAAFLLPHADPVHKITIVPRGRAGGYVMRVAEEDRMYMSRDMLLDTIGVALAGRAAEELIFNDITTGAQNDFQQATNIARRMVTSWGMSDALGRVALSSGTDSYLGEVEGIRTYSEETARLIDNEVKAIIDEQYRRVVTLLQAHRDDLETIVRVLLERETLHADEFAALMRGEKLPEHEPYVAPNPPAATTPPAKPDKPSKGPLLPPGMMPKPG